MRSERLGHSLKENILAQKLLRYYKAYKAKIISKHVKHINFEVIHACCVHITDCRLIAYQGIKAPFVHETKAYKISFLLM